MKKILYLFLSFTLSIWGIQAQDCNDVTATAVATPSTCQSNGSITITFSGASADKLVDKQYSVRSTTGGGINIGPVDTNVFNNLPAGTYNIEAKGFCNSLSGAPIVRTVNNVTVGGDYKEPRLSFIAAGATSTAAVPTSRNSYAGCDAGLIVLFLENGDQTTMPTFTITSAPAGVTVPQIVTATKATTGSATAGWRYMLNNTWPAGDYNVTANDGCYNATVSFNIKELTEVPPGTASPNSFSPYITDEPNCSKVNYSQNYSYTAASSPDFYRYAYDGFYEYGLAPIGETPTAENWYPITRFNGYTNANSFTLPGKLSDYYDTPNKLAVYTRLKDCPSLITSVTTYIRPAVLATTTSSNSCEGTQTYNIVKWTSASYEIFCYPLTIRITDQTTGELKYENTNYVYSTGTFSWTCRTGESFYRNITDANGRPLETNFPMTGIPSTNDPIPSFLTLSNGNQFCDSYDMPYRTTYPCDKGYPNPVYVTITDNVGTVVQKDTITSLVNMLGLNLKYGVTYTYTFSYPNSNIPDKILTSTVASNIPAGFTLSKYSRGFCADNSGTLRVTVANSSSNMKLGTTITVTGPPRICITDLYRTKSFWR